MALGHPQQPTQTPCAWLNVERRPVGSVPVIFLRPAIPVWTALRVPASDLRQHIAAYRAFERLHFDHSHKGTLYPIVTRPTFKARRKIDFHFLLIFKRGVRAHSG